MANRTFQEVNLTLVKRVVNLFPVVKVTDGSGTVQLQKRQYGAIGAGAVAPTFALVAAPTTGIGYAKGDGAGVNSVVRTFAGKWTITLSDPYQCLLGVSVCFANSGATFNAPIMVVDTTGNVQTNTSVGSGGTVKVVFYNGSGTATDPGSGELAYLNIALGDASEP